LKCAPGSFVEDLVKKAERGTALYDSIIFTLYYFTGVKGQRALVLISDGKENKGSIARAAWQAQQFGIPVDTYALAGRSKPALRVESVSLPPNAFTGEPFAIDLAVSSPKAGPAEVELSAEGRTLGKTEVSLAAGVNPVRMHTSLNTPGALELSIAIRAQGSDEVRLDQAVTLRRPKALYLSPDPPGIDGHLTNALTAAQFEVTRAADFGNGKLSDYQLVILNNWDLEKIAAARKSELEQYVKQGGGMLVIGGERNIYQEGKKTEDALDRTLPAKLLPPRSAEGTVVVLIIDKSSSMEGPKMELARAAATGVVSNLRPVDKVGVLIFDNSFRWAVPIRNADDRSAIMSRIAGINADGGTQIAPALTEAYQRILPTEATYRHIVLLTDGISEEGNSYSLARDAKAESRKLPVAAGTLSLIRDALADVVEEGTATKAQLGPIRVAGKTGTAQVFKKSAGVDADKLPKDERDHAWFIGYAPAENPEIAFAIVIEHGGHGGTTAAPVAKQVLEVFFADRLPPKEPAPVPVPALQAKLTARHEAPIAPTPTAR
jgi:hypothetical protein